MSLSIRIIGCFILGLLVLGLGYERVVNARVAAEKPQSLQVGPGASRPVASGGFPQANDVIEEGVLKDPKFAKDLLATNGIALALNEKDTRSPSGLGVGYYPRQQQPVEAEAAEDSRQFSIGEDTDIADRHNDDGPGADVVPKSVPVVPPSLFNTPILTETDNTEDVSAEERSENPIVGTRIVLEDAVFINGAETTTTELLSRKILTADGDLKFPYKKMPANWFLSTVESNYPEACGPGASQVELVTVRFRVNRGGRAHKPTTVSATNDCFSRAAVRAVRRMRFRVRAPAGYYYGGSIFLVTIEFSNQRAGQE